MGARFFRARHDHAIAERVQRRCGNVEIVAADILKDGTVSGGDQLLGLWAMCQLSVAEQAGTGEGLRLGSFVVYVVCG